MKGYLVYMEHLFDCSFDDTEFKFLYEFNGQWMSNTETLRPGSVEGPCLHGSPMQISAEVVKS